MDTSTETSTEPTAAPLLDAELEAELPAFEVFFKTFGFRRMHGRVWGFLVLAGRPLSSREISSELGISQGATSTTLNELTEWGAITSLFDSSRRCHLHAPEGNAISIVATVFRRREQVAFAQFKQTARRSLEHIQERYGERDPRVLTLRSIVTTCELAEALMQLVLGAVTSALGDSESLLSKAIQAALKVGFGAPARLLGQMTGQLSHPMDSSSAEADGNGSSPARAEAPSPAADADREAGAPDGAEGGELATSGNGRGDEARKGARTA